MKPSYEELEAKCNSLTTKLSMINGLMDAAEQANKLAQEATKNLVHERNALAAENAGLKALARGWANATDDRLFEEHGEIFHDSIDACEEELKTICPATDAFLAEVRAQGVDSAINTVISMMNHQHPVTSKTIDILRVHAYQLRKGVQS